MLNAYLLALAALLPLVARLRGPVPAAAGALAMAAGAVACAGADTTAVVVDRPGPAGRRGRRAARLRGGAGRWVPRPPAAAIALPALALALGPLAGGVFAEQNWWGVFFWAGVPLAAAAGAAALLVAAR